MRHNFLKSFTFVTFLVFTFVILSGLTGCRTIEKVVEKRDSIYITNNKLDSVYFYEKDSVFIKEKGDTIVVDKWHIRYKDKIVERVDTIYRESAVKSTEKIPVKYTPTFYKVCTWLWWLVVVLLLVWIAFFLVKKYYLHK